MGPLDAPIFSAIGENVNITARLELYPKSFQQGLLSPRTSWTTLAYPILGCPDILYRYAVAMSR